MDYSVQTEQNDERQVDIESMFVDAMQKRTQNRLAARPTY